MDFSKYLQYWPQIEAAFAGQGITITLVQLEAIVIELLPLFQKPPSPPPIPVPIPAPVPQPWMMRLPIFGDASATATGVFQPDLPPNSPEIIGENIGGILTFTVPAVNLDSWGGTIVVSAPDFDSITIRTIIPGENQPAITLQHTVPPPTVNVLFDHLWSGVVEEALRRILESGLAGSDGSNGQAVINKLNTLGLGPDANGEFQPHHNGPTGLPTYGFPKFYVSYVPLAAGGGPIPDDGSGRSYYQIVVFG